MNDNDAPPPPLPSIAGSRSTKKKRGRPPGSRNKKKGYKQIRREMAGLNLAFETAFGHIVGIAVHIADHEDND